MIEMEGYEISTDENKSYLDLSSILDTAPTNRKPYTSLFFSLLILSLASKIPTLPSPTPLSRRGKKRCTSSMLFYCSNHPVLNNLLTSQSSILNPHKPALLPRPTSFSPWYFHNQHHFLADVRADMSFFLLGWMEQLLLLLLLLKMRWRKWFHLGRRCGVFVLV